MTTSPPTLRSRLQNPAELVMLTFYFIGGAVMLVGGVTAPVRDALGDGFHQAWVGLLLGGPALSIWGILSPNQWLGGWFKLGGGLAITTALGAFAVSLGDAFGLTFTGVLVLGLNAATLTAVTRDALQLRRAAHAARRERRGSVPL
ncbi:hypothetical protein K8P10_001999 [Leucobacter sp. Psy1]|uniref:hypothetical protein n=1 Tax=Leucobacter sp. Psy1 TaxID=2875729 RepID=UPI001CD7D389|nr:hypothetical protein [Leucobacter sp. Psy1]UBH06488.1 hypothetical protein K8P10_001999 [Leucobacter sp. Psy1]